MKIYMAGSMRGNWNIHAEQIICMVFEHDGLSEPEFADPRNWADDYKTPIEYTHKDLMEIASSDAVLAHMSPANPSGYALCLEVGYAHGLGIPVFFWDQMANDWRSKYFGMVRACSYRANSNVTALAQMIMEKHQNG